MESRRPRPLRPLPLLRLSSAMLLMTALLCFSVWGSSRLLAREATADTRNTVSTDAAPDGDGTENSPGCIRAVIIDAGHGGEDAGAISATGTYEKDINLSVATQLRDMLEAAGVPVVMTRTEDKLLYDRNVDFEGRKKVLDMAARLNVVTAVRDPLLVSIHMNAFPQSKYHGAQVWYGGQDARSAVIAEAIQARIHAWQPDNDRRIKPSAGDIFLLDRSDAPAVLVEGGFLSNPTEAADLTDSAYQRQLAFVIFTGIMENLSAT